MSGAAASVPVELDGGRSYTVHIGPGARHLLGACLPRATRRVAIVTQAAVVDAGVVDAGVVDALANGPDAATAGGIEPQVFTIGATEAEAKTLAQVERLCRAFSEWGVHRGDAVVAVGGGVVTDVAGFASAVYLRGLPYVNVATTLLAQVDAAIGGKTGVNIPEGKNLVGAFWQPAAVICDTDLLATLPEAQWRSGRGEMVKYAFLGAGDLSTLAIEEQVARSVRLKAAVVRRDERESGHRMILNYGHTLAHALEGVALARGELDDLCHGEAVAIGIVFAAELARALGRIDAGRVAFHRELVAGFGLPTEIPPGLSAEELVAFMARDKKVRDGLTFVLDGPAGVEPVPRVARAEVVQVLTTLGCRP